MKDGMKGSNHSIQDVCMETERKVSALEIINEGRAPVASTARY
jgi:hypothetical protein